MVLGCQVTGHICIRTFHQHKRFTQNWSGIEETKTGHLLSPWRPCDPATRLPPHKNHPLFTRCLWFDVSAPPWLHYFCGSPARGPPGARLGPWWPRYLQRWTLAADLFVLGFNSVPLVKLWLCSSLQNIRWKTERVKEESGFWWNNLFFYSKFSQLWRFVCPAEGTCLCSTPRLASTQ